MKQFRIIDTIFLFLNKKGEIIYSSENIELMGLTYDDVAKMIKNKNTPSFKCKDYDISIKKINEEAESFYVVKIVCKNIRKIAYIDSLTNLYNRNIWEKIRRKGLEKENCCKKNTLIVIDMDNLKNINDVKGHLFGDKCIKKVAESIKDCIREEDMAFRIGGDEFVILLLNANKNQAKNVVERIKNKIRNKFEDTDKFISISAGISIFDSFAQIDEAFQKADMKMYREKRNKGDIETKMEILKLHNKICNIVTSDKIDRKTITEMMERINILLDKYKNKDMVNRDKIKNMII